MLQVLHHILPLFPSLTPRSSHIHSITRLHVTLSSASLTVPLLTSLVSGGQEKVLIAFQIAFDLVEGGSQDYLGELLSSLPQGAEVSSQGDSRPIF
jgi:26S proteasome regulatory subunit N2